MVTNWRFTSFLNTSPWTSQALTPYSEGKSSTLSGCGPECWEPTPNGKGAILKKKKKILFKLRRPRIMKSMEVKGLLSQVIYKSTRTWSISFGSQVWMSARHSRHVEEDNLQELVLSCYAGSRDWTQVVGFGGKHPYPLCYLSGPTHENFIRM